MKAYEYGGFDKILNGTTSVAEVISVAA